MKIIYQKPELEIIEIIPEKVFLETSDMPQTEDGELKDGETFD